MSKEHVDTQRAGELTGLSPLTLQALRHRGGGPEYLKIGNKVRYEIAELTRWNESRTVRKTSTSQL